MQASGKEPEAKRRRDLLADLRNIRGCTRTALSEILRALRHHDQLGSTIGDGASRTVRERMQDAVSSHIDIVTPYGPLLDKIPSPVAGHPWLEFVNPFALMYICGERSTEFFTMMELLCTRPLKLLLYIDEMTPGNPFRPEKSRSSQCVYFTFADLPSHVVVHSDYWFLMTVVRSSIVSQWPGQVSGFIKDIMKIMFCNVAPRFSTGVALVNNGRSILLRATFSGFLCDEKALKEIFALKGASGSKPCPTCQNLLQFVPEESLVDNGLVGLACADMGQLQYHTNESFYEMIDRLRVAHAQPGGRSMVAKLERTFGVNCDLDSLLFDADLRSIVRPRDHYCRDWMHTLMSHGVAGTESAMLMAALREAGFDHGMLTVFASSFKLPKSRGKVDVSWFAARRFGDDHLRSFASEQLNMLPILRAFLEDVVAPKGILEENIRCFTLLSAIVCSLQSGPVAVLSNIDRFRNLILAHHRLFVQLYPSGVKPKFHHLLHLPEDIERMGAALSCFPMERKHKTVKVASLNVFRHFERTVLVELAHHQLKRLVDPSLLQPASLIDAQAVVDRIAYRSRKMRLPVGETSMGDFCLTADRRVCRCEAFLKVESQLFVLAELFEPVRPTVWRSASAHIVALVPEEVVALLPWSSFANGDIRVCMPPM